MDSLLWEKVGVRNVFILLPALDMISMATSPLHGLYFLD